MSPAGMEVLMLQEKVMVADALNAINSGLKSYADMIAQTEHQQLRQALQKLRKTLPPRLPRRRRPGLRIARHTKYGFRPCRAGQRPCAGRCFGR